MNTNVRMRLNNVEAAQWAIFTHLYLYNCFRRNNFEETKKNGKQFPFVEIFYGVKFLVICPRFSVSFSGFSS